MVVVYRGPASAGVGSGIAGEGASEGPPLVARRRKAGLPTPLIMYVQPPFDPRISTGYVAASSHTGMRLTPGASPMTTGQAGGDKVTGRVSDEVIPGD